MLSNLLVWYNLPFTLMLLACVLLAGLQMIGLGGEHEGDGDVDHDVDLDHDLALEHDVDLDHDLALEHDADLDHDLDHDVDHDVDQDADHDADTSGDVNVFNVLAFVGVGKAPLMVVLLLFFGAIGILGWALNSLVSGVFGTYPELAFAAVLPISLIGGGLVSSRIARLIGRALPPISTTATRAQALVGRSGTVISPFVDEKYGLVHLRDQSGTLINVFAVTRSGEPLKRGCEVVLVAYDPAAKRYTVTTA